MKKGEDHQSDSFHLLYHIPFYSIQQLFLPSSSKQGTNCTNNNRYVTWVVCPSRRITVVAPLLITVAFSPLFFFISLLSTLEVGLFGHLRDNHSTRYTMQTIRTLFQSRYHKNANYTQLVSRWRLSIQICVQWHSLVSENYVTMMIIRIRTIWAYVNHANLCNPFTR